MKTVFAVITATIIAAAFATTSASADIGSCYSPKPFCYGNTSPVCMCTITQQCWWACR